LEHRAGMLQAFSPAGRVRADGPIAAGREWHILRLGLNVKRYPVCYALHRSIDGLLDLNSKHKIAPENIREIELRIGKLQAGILRHSRPQTGLDAKFSAEFAAACAVVAGRVGLAELTDDFVRTNAIQALLPKVKVTTVDDSDPDEPLFAKSDIARVTLADDSVLSGDIARVTLADDSVLSGEPVSHALGHARNPIGIDELKAKFSDCLGQSPGPHDGERLFSKLADLDRIARVADLYPSGRL
jgi:aconitate decarboxylase